MNTIIALRTVVRRFHRQAVALLFLCAGSALADPPEGHFFVSTAGLDSPTYGVGHTTIQGAINASSSGNTVWIEDGFVCDTGGTFVSGAYAQTNRILLNKAITLRSVSGTTNNPVMIVGAHHDPAGGIIHGTAAIRPLYVSEAATMIGLMMTNGATSGGNGGGAFLTGNGTSAVISNCVIVANKAELEGGGVRNGNLRNSVIKHNSSGSNRSGGGLFGGTAEDCHFLYNDAHLGGGASDATLKRCTLIGNDARWAGGGARLSTLEHCVLIANTSSGQNGGGAASSTLIDCVLTGNTASYNGSAIWGGKALRCVITNNVNGRIGGSVIHNAEVFQSEIRDNRYTTGGGGVIRFGSVVNSLITGNVASYADTTRTGAVVNATAIYNSTLADNPQGRAAIGATLVNTIVWNNWQHGHGNIATNSLIAATAVASGQDNLDTNPLFVGTGEWPYRLSGTSLCIDHGIGGFDWMLPSHPDTQGRDMSGRRRVIGSAVDLGAFEFMPQGTVIAVH